jgi:hypothetical protein
VEHLLPKRAASAAGKHTRTGLYIRSKQGLRVRDKNVERLARRARNLAPWAQPGDFPLFKAWAQFEYLCMEVYGAIKMLGVLNNRNEARRLLDDFRKLRMGQLQVAAALGLTPAGRIEMQSAASGIAVDLAKQMAELDNIDASNQDGGPRDQAEGTEEAQHGGAPIVPEAPPARHEHGLNGSGDEK